ncbi:fibronectin type III domain-containing protein [Candidatus Parcubacteria bacterium]|nr:fibronectin type III domain-containing protein [Patescibacteria group bacterium]MBU4309949.1 fibronectin type III domain-containing protein [Patescibacteria group bacterium]MBU4577874.1 fibronectin type III domain-containing protein [Patescibacteria group bacterium]MCG2696935.1 fibronectin type III domain-containing protein [Candidatus Parcubacteria bacterium]
MLVRKGKTNIPFDLLKNLRSQLKERKFSWRFVFLAGLIIYVFGFSPFGFARKTIRAIMGVDVAVVDLYVGNASLSSEQTDFKTGWWSEQKTLGEPDLGPNDELMAFNDGNSAFYSGGKYSLILDNFLPSTDYSVATDDQAIISVEQPVEASSSVTEPEVQGDIDLATTTEVQGDIDIATTTEDVVQPDLNTEEEAPMSSSDEPLVDDYDNVQIIESIQTPVLDNDSVEVIEPVQNPGGAEETPKEVSWLDKTLNFFGKISASVNNYYALAQDSVIDLESFGNFQGATIKFSLATANIKQEAGSLEQGVDSVVNVENDLQQLATSSDEIASSTDVLPSVEDLVATSTQSRLDVLRDFFAKKVNAQTDDKIVIWYAVGEVTSTSTDSLLWQELGRISNADASNALHGGYFEYDASFLKNWTDVKNLHLKLEGVNDSEDGFVFYLDSAWVSAEYEVADNAPELEALRRARWEQALQMLSDQKDFKINEKGEIRFKYTKNNEKLLSKVGEFLGWTSYWSDIDLRAELIGKDGQVLNFQPTIFFEDDGEFVITLPDLPADFEPGKYSIKFIIIDNSGDVPETIEITRDFSWGVLALNYDKSVYRENERAYLQMAALDDGGHTLCDAELLLRIISPSGVVKEFDTASGTIALSPACGPETVTDVPDYFAYYDVAEAGQYAIELTAITRNGTRNISDVLEVKGNLPLEVQRVGATRIFPKADYVMTMLVTAKEDYSGDIVESMPANFRVVSNDLRITNSIERDPYGPSFEYEENVVGDRKILTWKGVEILKGDILEIKYRYDAPDVSPEFYLLGPLTIGSATEMRPWQIASDAVINKVKTVAFMAGVYNGGATTGQNTNTNNSFANFNFKLAETGVVVKNAYIMFEAQIEGYVNNTGNYTGYTLGFDACQESCTANSLTGVGRVAQADGTVLSFDESESNQVRLLFDVTSEAQLAAYTGAGALMQGALHYNFAFGSVINSIANAKAVLYVTYTYDTNTVNQTNTVTYPLDSTNGTDNGSRQASIGACTRNSTCPLFDYKMDIPEFPSGATSTSRLSQWFRFYDANSGNTTTDLDPNINLTGVDVNSASFHYEAALRDQVSMPAMYFPDWASSGYAENSSQQVEYYINSATNFGVGGEIFETYISSSSAATKTRTVSLPMGIINNGAVNTLTSKEVGVYFPENGSATGTVKIKSAWVRLITSNVTSANQTITVSSTVGDNATSTNLAYDYNSGTTITKPSFNLIHIIPVADYAELEKANSATVKKVRINTTASSLTYGGISAELMITYTYTSENNGYLASVRMYGGQSMTAGNSQSATVNTANAVLPEPANKTILAAGVLSSYLFGNSTVNSMPTANILLGTNLSTSSPVCSNIHTSFAVGVNMTTEFYRDVTANLLTTNNQTYQACYTNNGAANATTGAKMNGQFIYTYKWDNFPPTGSFNSAVTRRDGTGVVDLSLEVYDVNNQESRAKLEFATGTSCVFSPAGDPTIDETDANVTADYGDPQVLNTQTYQIGTEANPIRTASGTNSVFVDWQTQSDLQGLEGTYCVRLTANDFLIDQATPATTTVYIDNLKPTAPGALSLNKRTGSSVILNFGATSTETNFVEYKIFYKLYDGTDPTELSSVLSSSTDVNLANKLFNGKATTTISGLNSRTKYSFAIWTYDAYGNKASSSRVDIETNDAPTVSVNSLAQRADGGGVVDLSIEVDDSDNDDTVVAKMDYVLGAACNFASPAIPTLDTTQANIQADWGAPTISNAREYQIGTSSSFIITSPGSNTVDFDWFGKTNLPTGDATYCVRLQVKDDLDSQILVATSTLTIDNVTPTLPGALMNGGVTTNSVTLIFATTTPATDTNPPTVNAYKIFYKEGTSGVTEADTEYDLTALNAYNYSGATSSKLSGLNPDTNYVFNIWAYDKYGNKVASTEITVKTSNTIVNNSLTFVNATSTKTALASGDEWIFRAVVSEENGWTALDNVRLRLADNVDNVAPYGDLEFTWNQATNQFTETGTDTANGVSLGNSTSDCLSNTCTLDFKLIFSKTFANTNVEYNAGLYSTNDVAKLDDDNYSLFYKVQKIFVKQIHYRWRNDDGGE